MEGKQEKQISFELSPESAQAIERLAQGRLVRLSGQVKDGRLVIDNVGFANSDFNRAVFAPVNAPFMTERVSATA